MGGNTLATSKPITLNNLQTQLSPMHSLESCNIVLGLEQDLALLGLLLSMHAHVQKRNVLMLTS